MTSAHAAIVWLVTLAISATAAAQRPQFPADSVYIGIELTGQGTARVREYLRLALPVRTADFTYLARACNAVSALTAARGAVSIGVASDTTAPWVTVHDTTERADSTAGVPYEMRYEVSMSGEDAHVPVLMPAAVLTTTRGASSPTVIVEADLARGGPRARVASPRMHREGPWWIARFAALPATIVLAGVAATDAPCEERGRTIRGDSGTFWVRFALLLATMALWVPLYFVWARLARSHETEAPS